MSAEHRPYLAAGDAAEQAAPAVTVLESPDPAPGAEPTLPVVGERWFLTTETGVRTVTVTRVWDADSGPAIVVFEWRDAGGPRCGADLRLPVFLGTYQPEQPPTPAPALSDGERSYLLFALELAEDEMRACGTEFGDDDRAALDRLRKLAGGES